MAPTFSKRNHSELRQERSQPTNMFMVSSVPAQILKCDHDHEGQLGLGGHCPPLHSKQEVVHRLQNPRVDAKLKSFGLILQHTLGSPCLVPQELPKLVRRSYASRVCGFRSNDKEDIHNWNLQVGEEASKLPNQMMVMHFVGTCVMFGVREIPKMIFVATTMKPPTLPHPQQNPRLTSTVIPGAHYTRCMYLL